MRTLKLNARDFILMTATLLPLSTITGCNQSDPTANLSPTVSEDSDLAAKARAQDEKLREDRKKQEAALHRRFPKTPVGE